jgi:hypothetical protein
VFGVGLGAALSDQLGHQVSAGGKLAPGSTTGRHLGGPGLSFLARHTSNLLLT